MKRESGFSLIEMAIVLVVASVLGAAALEVYNQYARTKVSNIEFERQDNVVTAISRFMALNGGRMPCPADPALPENDATSGRENCAGTGGVLLVPGARDVDGDGTMDPVLIGAVPYVTLGISPKETIDGYGSRMTYAVTRALATGSTNLTDSAVGIMRYQPFVSANLIDGGAMDIPESVQPRLNQRVVDVTNPGGTPNAFPFVLVMHGPDRAGAYQANGRRAVPCDAGTLNAENCDDDAIFAVSDFRQLDAGVVDGYRVSIDDSYVIFDVSASSDNWQGTGSAIQNSISAGNVGVGTGLTGPGEKLDVRGDVRADQIRASRFCSAECPLPPAGAPIPPDPDCDCFRVELIGGAGASCAGGLATGIANDDIQCAGSNTGQVNTAGNAWGSCPAGCFVYGFGSGYRKCRNYATGAECP